MTTLSVTARRDGRTGIVAVAGELDLSGTASFTAAVDELLDQGVPDVRVELDEVTFIDSSGLSALMVARETVAATGRSFRLGPVSESVAHVLELSGLRDELRPEVI